MVDPRQAGGRAPDPVLLQDLGEDEILAAIQPVLGIRHGQMGVLVGPGDDAAVLDRGAAGLVATTDSMLRGVDWRDDWSAPHEVGQKLVTQNLADVQAMGALPSGVLLAVAADRRTSLRWLVELCRGIGETLGDCPVLGGDLSSAPAGVVALSMTALGDLAGHPPVLRSGATPGDVVAVRGTLGRSGGGLALLAAGERAPDPTEGPRADAVATLLHAHRSAPGLPQDAGWRAAQAGATAMIDVSDGLVRDAQRLARGSRVCIDLSGAELRHRHADGPLTLALGADEAWRQVLSGGEEHALLGCFPGAQPLPEEWVAIGTVLPMCEDGATVTVDGLEPHVRGWDHFAG